MSRMFRLTRCPYCHRKISFFTALLLKTKGEYRCNGCKCISNVRIRRSIYGIASITCVLALLILLIYSSFGNHGNIMGVIFVLLPFVLFYCIVPFFVRLEPCIDRSLEEKIIEKKIIIPSAQNEVYDTGSISKPSNPIELNVSDDFSKNFIKTKSIVDQKVKDEIQETDQIQETDEIKEIHNE